MAGLLGLAFAAPADRWLICWLAVLGLGLGLFTPSNNETLMRAVPRELSGTGGGMVNTARALGTALGIAVVTLTLELGDGRGAGSVLPPLPVLTLAAAAALAGAATLRAGR